MSSLAALARRTLTFVGLVGGALQAQPAAGRPTATPADASARFGGAVDAWRRGAYADALEELLRLMASSQGPAYLDRVAMLTGELHVTTRLAPDARLPQWSPDGGWVAFETDTGSARRTTLVDPSGTGPSVAISGYGLAFGRGGRVGYLASGAPTVGLRERFDGEERRVSLDGLVPVSLAWSDDGETLYLVAAREDGDRRTDLFALRGSAAFSPLVVDDSVKRALVAIPGGRHLLYVAGGRSPVPRTRLAPGTVAVPPAAIGVHDLGTGTTRYFTGSAPAVSADGSTVAFIGRAGTDFTLNVLALGQGAPAVVLRTPDSLAAPSLSPSGRRVAYQRMSTYDWEIFVAGRDGVGETRVTREVQHDVLPRFLDENRLIAMTGEARDRRSHLYDLSAGTRTRLFHNNTVRTIAPEYAWVPSPDGNRLLIVAERDGDTVSPERDLSLVDLTRRVSRSALTARLRNSLAGERALREHGERIFRPIAAEVRARVAEVSVPRIIGYEQALFDFGSKHITKPGNLAARGFLFEQYRAFGYEPVLQEFGAGPIRTANVVATLRGTTNPELVYVVGSHFDSRAEGPGADDNGSGTAALLEAARVLRAHPLPATVVFASFTGEEAGLLGSREFVRRAGAEGWKVAGALNNDMLGWTNDGRLDNTIRYSNDGIRDVQHGAAMGFTRMITYDARYYKSTDAAAFFEAWGDIVGGIGSYPVLGNPHYHQPHDRLEFENHELIAEAARTTVASVMLLASSPSRIRGLTAIRTSAGPVELSWTPSPERGVRGYVVLVRPPGGRATRMLRTTAARLRVGVLQRGDRVAVKAIDERGLEGWDWADIAVP